MNGVPSNIVLSKWLLRRTTLNLTIAASAAPLVHNRKSLQEISLKNPGAAQNMLYFQSKHAPCNLIFILETRIFFVFFLPERKYLHLSVVLLLPVPTTAQGKQTEHCWMRNTLIFKGKFLSNLFPTGFLYRQQLVLSGPP